MGNKMTQVSDLEIKRLERMLVVLRVVYHFR